MSKITPQQVLAHEIHGLRSRAAASAYHLAKQATRIADSLMKAQRVSENLNAIQAKCDAIDMLDKEPNE